MKQVYKRFAKLLFVGIFSIVSTSMASAQGVQCDPSKVLTAATCARCHASEVAVWKNTPHCQTYEQLSRNPKAKEICNNMGLRSVKRSGICIDCHFTTKQVGEKIKPVSGISCESCHGAAKDWIDIHYDYGGPNATKASETREHAVARYQSSIEMGMRNTRDLYSIASSCYRCHTVPNEKLVNTGGHKAGTADFEFVRWSQGMIRHNFVRSNGKVNDKPSPERLRVMYVVGLIADLEYSTRATASATMKSTFGTTVAQRAADRAIKLFQLQESVQDPDIQNVLEAFAEAKLSVNNADQLNTIADRIRTLGRRFASRNDGSKLASVDELLPPESEYKR